MTALMRVRATVDGWSGGPGLMTFYFTGVDGGDADASGVVGRVHDAIVLGAGLWNRNIHIQVQGAVDILNPANGNVTGTTSVTAPASITGAENDDTFLPLGSSVLLRLKTSTFIAGRRIQGRIFLSPLGGNNGDPNGTPNAAALASALAMGNKLMDETGLSPAYVVWRRPRPVKPATHPATFDRDGAVANVTAVQSPDKYAILRSRRD